MDFDIANDDYIYQHEDCDESTLTCDTSQFKDTISGNSKHNNILFTVAEDYSVYSYEEIQKLLNQDIYELMNEYGISENMAMQTLMRKDWNLEKAIQHIKADANYDFYQEKPKASDQFNCMICFSTVELIKGCILECGHLFCEECFVEYLSENVKEGDGCCFKTCPYSRCKELISNSIYEKYLPKELLERYQKFRTKNIVDACNSFMRCPDPNCSNVIYFNSFANDNERKAKNIRCECRNYFCFLCKHEAHRPLGCDFFNKWQELTGDKSQMLNSLWILKNTKKCPKCKTNIEKNLGCMEMRCLICHYNFCWNCLDDWEVHGEATGGYYDCYKYIEDNKNAKSDEIKELERLDFYKTEYDDHKRAIRKAEEKRLIILKNLRNIKDIVKGSDEPEINILYDDQFMKEAMDLIVESRRAVTMTYPFAYYMKFTEIQQNLFEYQQAYLGIILDQLDEFTDKFRSQYLLFKEMFDIEEDKYIISSKFLEFRNNMIGRVAGVTKACNQILSYIENDLQGELLHQQEEIKRNDTVEKYDLTRLPEQTSLKENRIQNTNDYSNYYYWYCVYCYGYVDISSDGKCDVCVCKNTKKYMYYDDLIDFKYLAF